jgi:Helix-turn-helix
MRAIREMHGLSHTNGKRTPEHRLWLNIRNKCNNPNTPDYKYYGARGITVCARWDRFSDFLADVGFRPSPELTLDRIETDGNYEPGNVRWATRQTQARNRNYCVLDETKAAEIREHYRSGGVTQRELAEQYGVAQAHISQVVRGIAWPS